MMGALAPFSYLVANVITRRQLARSMHRDLNHRDHGIHIEKVCMQLDIGMALLYDGFTRISLLFLEYYLPFIFKRPSFWPSADAK